MSAGKSKKIYFGAQRELKKTERRPTQTEAWKAHQIRYWGLKQIHEGLRQQGLPTPKKLLKEIEKYKNMDLIKNPDKVEKYYKFIDDKESKLKEAQKNIMKEEERLMKEKDQLLEEEKILKNKAATKLQSLVRMRKAKKELEALKKAKKETSIFAMKGTEPAYELLNDIMKTYDQIRSNLNVIKTNPAIFENLDSKMRRYVAELASLKLLKEDEDVIVPVLKNILENKFAEFKDRQRILSVLHDLAVYEIEIVNVKEKYKKDKKRKENEEGYIEELDDKIRLFNDNKNRLIKQAKAITGSGRKKL
jgi:hypothetical protein